jgi:hypothetical protein
VQALLLRVKRDYFQMPLPGNRPAHRSDGMQSVLGKPTEIGVHPRAYRQRPEGIGPLPRKTANNRTGRNRRCFSRSTTLGWSLWSRRSSA